MECKLWKPTASLHLPRLLLASWYCAVHNPHDEEYCIAVFVFVTGGGAAAGAASMVIWWVIGGTVR